MSSSRKEKIIELSIVILLLGVSLALRLYRLQDFPPGLYVDEAANGVDALDVLAGKYSIFFERNTGREPILIYLQALAISLLGATPYALRVVPAFIGALTVPAIYWMVREAFRRDRLPSRWLGLWTALFVAFSYWHISLSRLGFRAILLPLVASLAFVFFWRAWNQLSEGRKTPWLNLVLCGVFTGLCLYTYTAGRLTPIWIALTFFFGAVQLVRSVGAARLAISFGVITGVALLVFVPLGGYFLLNPEQFYGRAADVSVFNPYFAGDLPGRALMVSIVDTARMFVDRGDPNLRHNPAGRPVFDLLMAAWLLAGLGLAVVRIRVLPYFFALSGFLIFAIPAVITAEGVPHSLRAIGMLPMAYLLAVVAMMAVGQAIGRRFKWATLWTPLPFLLVSAIIGTQSYFGAWQDIDRFRGPFQSDFQTIDMSAYGDGDAVWIWPLSPNYHWSDNTFYPLEYLHRGNADVGFAWLDDETISSSVAEATNGKQIAYLVRTQDMAEIESAPYIMGDPKHLLEFVLEKYGRRIDEIDADENDSGIPFVSYELPEQSSYAVHNSFVESDASFAGQVRLLGHDLGHVAIDPAINVEVADAEMSTNRVAAGEKLWVVLNWEALAPVDVDLKASLVLMDEAGNLAGQVDDLLVGDRYPVDRTWGTGEQTKSYHILPLWSGVLPGAYDLTLRVYEDGSQRAYPLVDEDGALLSKEFYLDSIEVEPSMRPQVVEPEHRPDAEFTVGSDVMLIGYDLPRSSISPGDRLPVTLYWQAEDVPPDDYQITLTLADGDGQPVVESQAKIGGAGFGTGSWRAQEVVRDWQTLSIPPDISTGSYELLLSDGSMHEMTQSIVLGAIDIQGRARLYEEPSFSQPVDAQYDQIVRLIGVDAPEELTVDPGQVATFNLVWQVVSPPQTQLTRFVHLLGADGMPVAQQDTVPCEGACPSSSWTEDEYLVDPVAVALPDDLSTGTYTVVVGWYDPETFLRPTAIDGNGQRHEDGLIALPIDFRAK